MVVVVVVVLAVQAGGAGGGGGQGCRQTKCGKSKEDGREKGREEEKKKGVPRRALDKRDEPLNRA